MHGIYFTLKLSMREFSVSAVASLLFVSGVIQGCLRTKDSQSEPLNNGTSIAGGGIAVSAQLLIASSSCTKPQQSDVPLNENFSLSSCSATWVGPHEILTAAHCVNFDGVEFFTPIDGAGFVISDSNKDMLCGEVVNSGRFAKGQLVKSMFTKKQPVGTPPEDPSSPYWRALEETAKEREFGWPRGWDAALIRFPTISAPAVAEVLRPNREQHKRILLAGFGRENPDDKKLGIKRLATFGWIDPTWKTIENSQPLNKCG